MQNIRTYILSICAISFSAFNMNAENDNALIKTINQYQSFPEMYVNSSYANPAVNIYAHKESLSKIEASINLDRQDDALIEQLGMGHTKGNITADAWLMISPKTYVWGKVSFNTGRTYDVKWTETSNFLTLYPYVEADSVGGSLNSTQYKFMGGYGGKSDKWSWGIEGSYNASISSRHIDPRPRNLVSEFDIKVGGAYNAFSDYVIGADATYSLYTQDNDIEFLNPTNNIYVYTMTGLGTYYKRFSGSVSNISYKGNGYDVSVQLTPKSKYGIHANIKYKYLATKRILRDNNYLDLTHLHTTNLMGNVGYLTKLNTNTIGIYANGDYETRAGIENIFDSNVGSNYTKIGSRENFSGKILNASVRLLYGKEINDIFTVYISPSATYMDTKIKYTENNRKVRLDRIAYNIQANGCASWGRNRISLTLGGGYLQGNGKYIVLDGMNMQSSIYLSLMHNYDRLTSNAKLMNAEARYDIAVKNRIGLYVTASSNCIFYSDNNNSYNTNVAIGMNF